MSDDIQKETERIHQGIVESLSFSEALANRDNEIKRLAIELESADRVANDWAKKNVELKAEIERLRGLLREGIGDIWIKNADGSFTCMYEAIAAWHKRVREALGD